MSRSDGEDPAEDVGPLPRRFDRRMFVVGLGAAAAGWALPGLPPGTRRVEASPDPVRARTFTPEEWRTLAAALDRLLPSKPGSPGAVDVNAIGYLDAILADADIDPLEVPLVRDGAARLDQRAKPRGGASFAALPEAEQDTVIRGFESTEGGKTWLKVVLGYLMEAFLGDPIHGAQPGEVGWRWAGIDPGVPRPTGTEQLPMIGETGGGPR